MSDAQVLTQKPEGASTDPAVPARAWLWAALLLAGYLPLLTRFGGEQWDRPQYQFFPLMLLAAAHLAWRRLHEMRPGLAVPGSRTVTIALLGLSLLIFLAASVLWSGRLAAVSAWIALAGLAWRAGGRPMLRALVPVGLLLAIVIGPPVGMDEPLLQQMREWAVWTSSSVLVWLGVPHLVTGTVIEIPGSRLLVAEACSGINSMMAVLSFTLVLGFWRRRSAAVISILVAAGVLLVLWANMVRIAGGVWLKAHWNVDILTGDVHQFASLVLFTVCMGLIFSTDHGLSLIRRARARKAKAARRGSRRLPSPVPAAGSLPLPPLTGAMWGLASLILLVGIAQIAHAAASGGVGLWLGSPSAPHLRPDAAFTAPAKVGQWQRSQEAEKSIAQPEIVGKSSQAWAYQAAGLTAIVAIDYPFAGYHDLTICYRNAGWTIADQVENPPQPQTGAFTVVRVARLNEWGYLWYASIDESGQWTQPPSATAAGRLQERLRHLGRPDWNAASYQVQIWVQSFRPLDAAAQKQLSELFLGVRDLLGQQVLDQLEGHR